MWRFQLNHVLHLGSAYQLENQHNFPSFTRLPQTIWDLLNLCGLFDRLPLLNKISLPIWMLGIYSDSVIPVCVFCFCLFFFFLHLNNTLLSGCKIGHSFEFLNLVLRDFASFFFLQDLKVRHPPSSYVPKNTVNAVLSLFVPHSWQSTPRFLIFYSLLFDCIPQKRSSMINKWSKCEQH